MKNCYEVLCKGGHVGRNHYYPMYIYIMAEDGRTAAAQARRQARVKHDHKDAILQVQKITYAEYLIGKKSLSVNGYFRAHSKQEMYALCPDIENELLPEVKFARGEDDFDFKQPLSYCNRKKYTQKYTCLA